MSQTTAIHGDDGIESSPDVAPPIHVSTTFDRTDQESFVYRREHHATTRRLEAVIGALEGGHGVAYSSGMAATAAIFGHYQPGRVALQDDLYGGTRALAQREQERGHLAIVEPDELGDGDLWWVETPSNPKCHIIDVAAVAEAAHAVGAKVVVDSTFATPALQQPLALGADAVMHSTTKFIAGHSDSMGGMLVVRDAAQAEALEHDRTIDGSVPGALDVWLTLRGVRTLPLRMQRQSESAAAIADFLSSRVPATYYPTIAGNPGSELGPEQMSAFGGVVSFEMESLEQAGQLRDRLKLFHNATSLGGVESIADVRREHDSTVPDGLIRLSVGLEDAEDLIADLEQALSGA